MTTSPRVLLVEDEPPILEGLMTLFASQGFSPEPASDGEIALEALLSSSFELVILDLMLPKLTGLEVLRRARAAGLTAPVVILTARGAEDDVVAGLEAGADDYVTKPFGIRELIARAKGLLRRAPREETRRAFEIGDARFSLDDQLVTHGAREIPLTSREVTLLAYLLDRRHRPVGRDELLVDVWGYRDGSVQTRTVDVHVQQLRKKLGDALPWIKTVRGRGYRFAGELVT